MASISAKRMLDQLGAAVLAASFLGTMGVGALQAQTSAPQGEEEEVRWTLPPPSHLLTTPTQPGAAAPAEAANPFGSAPVSRLQSQPVPQEGASAPEPAPSPIAAPVAAEAPSILAPPLMPPAALLPPVAAPQLAPAAVAQPAPAPQQTAKKPAAKTQAPTAQASAKPAAEKSAKPLAAKPAVAAKPAQAKPAQASKPASAKVAAAKKPVVQPRAPEPVPPPPAMTEKDPDEGRIPVISSMMDGVGSVGRKIGGLFD